MQDTRIPFGEREGNFYRAFEVENGVACGCICPGCRKPLNAANGGKKVIPHFRHVHSEYCDSGYAAGVRRAAVALIAAQRCLVLPAFHRRVSVMTDSRGTLSREVVFPGTSATADKVERYVDLGDVLAHAVFTTGKRQLFERCEQAAEGLSTEVIDLRTLMPWDRDAVLASVRKTHRCLVVHEDLATAGFGAEIAAVVADQAFIDLDAPVARLTMPDIPSPHHPVLMEFALPSVDDIRSKILELVGF